jgi:hypothetical protein
MNSASGGLRPTVGLRRPKNPLCVGEGRRPAHSAFEGRFQSARRPSAHGRPARRPGKRSLRRRRPTPGAQRLGRPISIGAEPPAHGRPARRMNSASRGLLPTVGLRRPKNPLCVGEGRRPARSAFEGRFQSAQRPSANGRPAPTEKSPLRRRRPTPGAQRLGRPISIGAEPPAEKSVGLRRPNRNPLCVGEGRRPARSALEGRFQSARKLPARGRPASVKKTP